MRIIIVFLIPFLIISCDKKDTEAKFHLSFNISDRTKSVMADSLDEPDAVLLTIENSKGNVEYETKRIELYKMNNIYMTKSITLNAGKYAVTKCIIINKDGDILYATPISGSNNSSHVENALPVNFIIGEDINIDIELEVIAVEPSDDPEAFGYVSFSFDIIDLDGDSEEDGNNSVIESNIEKGLVAYYPFNGNAVDETGNQHDGVVNGATLVNDRFGMPQSAYCFDGVDDFIELNNNKAIINSNAYTISAWVKMKGKGGGIDQINTLFQQRCDPTSSSNISFQIENLNDETKLVMRGYNDIRTEKSYVASSSPAYDKWHHYVGIMDENNSLKLYIDGKLVATGQYTGNEDYSSGIDYVDIGRHRYGGKDMALLNGLVDEMRIYNRAINQQEIFELFNEDPGLVAYYPFTGDAVDKTGNGHDGIVEGATLTKDRFGNTNSAYDFDGVDDYIELNNNEAIIKYEEYTISAWAKMEGKGGGLDQINTLFQQRNDPTISSNISFHTENLHGEVKLVMRGYNDGRYDKSIVAAPMLGYDEWHHYVFIMDKSKNMYLYCDGELVATSDYTGNDDYYSGIDYVDIGRHRYGGKDMAFFNGFIDEVKIYKRAITEQEIQKMAAYK